ncbi:MAG: hypothetical protein KGY81_07095, partial [Phycisphaerae bacterium]|nr:hypothetical protein [Phycisphaerae bacterium]
MCFVDHIPANLISRLQNVNTNIKERGIKRFDRDGHDIVSGYSYGEFYDWDLYFECIYLSYYGVATFCQTNVKSFLKQQYVNGFVPRTLIGNHGMTFQHVKPFLAQTVWLGYQQSGTLEWIKEREGLGYPYFSEHTSYYEKLKKSMDYWFWYQDYDKNGLPVWDSADHSGMDNQDSRAGRIRECFCEGVDLASYLIREMRALARIAEALGHEEDARTCREHAIRLADLVNSVFWDSQDGFYYDRHEVSGERISVKSVAGFTPLWAGIVPKERAQRLIEEHLFNEQEFWLAYPVSGYARTEPDYVQAPWPGPNCNWRGTTWIPLNYMIVHALRDYGYQDKARELVEKTFDLVYRRNPVTREYYNAETGSGQGLDPFWGWSALAYFMGLEYDLNYNPMDLDGTDVKPLAVDCLGME